VIPTNNGRDDIDTWPGEHYKKTRAKARYIGRLHPPKPQCGEYIYSPPAWMFCGVCGGHGKVDMGLMTGHARGRIETCYECRGTGRIPIHYTPEQWQEAGGILADDTPVYMQDDDFMWYLLDYADVPKNMDMIIATTAGRPPEDWNG